MSRDDVLDRAANNMMLLSNDIRNSAKVTERSTEALKTVAESIMAMKREVHEALGPGGAIDGVVREVRHEISQVNRQLAIISKDVDDVERVTREATGAHALMAIDPKVKLLREFGALDRYTKTLIATAVVAAGGIGALVHWLATLGGK